MIRSTGAAILIGTLLVCLAQPAAAQAADDLFNDYWSEYRGYSERPGYDLQPTALYDPDSAAPFKLWWLGQYRPGDVDLPPANLDADDRVYYAESADGESWTNIRVVLKGQAGTGGYDAANDHLLGSPSVLKINGTYYMFYEAYGTWATVVNRFCNAARDDMWTTNGAPYGVFDKGGIELGPDSPTYDCDGGVSIPDWDPRYSHESSLGFAPFLRKTGTHPIYSGEVTYRGSGKINRFLTARGPARDECTPAEKWRPLHVGPAPALEPIPVFWLYDDVAEDRVPCYACFDAQFSNSFVSLDPGCEGHGVPDVGAGMPGRDHLLGFLATDLNGPDMYGSLQNRICLATSSDGINWTRVRGPARGGAMLAAYDESAREYPHDCGGIETWDIHRSYGAGYPSALVRDGMLELYYGDDTEIPIGECIRPPLGWRVTLPVSDILSNAAWTAAADRRQRSDTHSRDVKWSPLFRRYFIEGILAQPGNPGDCDSAFRQSAMLYWSEFDPNPATGPTWDETRRFQSLLPTQGEGEQTRYASWGAILSDGLGHTLDYPNAQPPYTAFHLYYAGIQAGACGNGATDLDHLLLFVTPRDCDSNGIPNWQENLSTLYVNWAYDGCEDGHICCPYSTVHEGRDSVALGGTIRVAPGAYSEILQFTHAVRIETTGGVVRIGP